MLESAEMVAFLATADGERCRAFYEGVLGLEFVSGDDFALVFRSGGMTLRISRVESPTVAPYTVLGWRVPDVRDAVTELRARGVVFEVFAGMGQDELGIWTPPGGGTIAWFKDPDGHLLSVGGMG